MLPQKHYNHRKTQSTTLTCRYGTMVCDKNGHKIQLQHIQHCHNIFYLRTFRYGTIICEKRMKKDVATRCKINISLAMIFTVTLLHSLYER